MPKKAAKKRSAKKHFEPKVRNALQTSKKSEIKAAKKVVKKRKHVCEYC